MLFRGGTLSSPACVVAGTVGQVLGYKLQLDQALEMLEVKDCFLLNSLSGRMKFGVGGMVF